MYSHIIRRPLRRHRPLNHWLALLIAALPLGVSIGVGIVANLGG